MPAKRPKGSVGKGDQMESEQNWTSASPEKWEKIASGRWIQKTVWNRMVTLTEREQPHVDFMTRDIERDTRRWVIG